MGPIKAKRTAVFLALAGTAVALMGASVAHAGFRPGLIAFYTPNATLGSSGAIVVFAPGKHPSSGDQIASGFGGGLAWSPNGETLAFTARNSPTDTSSLTKIVIATRDGRVIDTPVRSGTPESLSWSPDGKEIVYVCHPLSTTGENWQLCLLNVTTGVHRLLLSPTGSLQALFTSVVSWSPRGDEVAYDTNVPVPCSPEILSINPSAMCADYGIATLDVKTGVPTLITDPAAFAESPAFSPDGNEIVYKAGASTVDGPVGLNVMSASGRFLRNVVPASDTTCHGCAFQDPTWSPDGKKILFNSDPSNVDYANLFTVDANGARDMTQETKSGVSIQESSWAPVVTTCTVPKLKGQTFAKAKVLIGLAGCVLGKVTGPKKNRSGRHVVNQNPRGNKDVATGTKINIQIR
jgi:Tol biopolymer transport system component